MSVLFFFFEETFKLLWVLVSSVRTTNIYIIKNRILYESERVNIIYFCSIRLAFEAIFHKSATLRDANPEQQSLTDITDKDQGSSQIIQVSKKVQLVFIIHTNS